jgi:hypothetical protein
MLILLCPTLQVIPQRIDLVLLVRHALFQQLALDLVL